MAEEYTEGNDFPQVIPPGFDEGSNPMNVYREAITDTRLNRAVLNGEPGSVNNIVNNQVGNYKTGANPSLYDDGGNGTMDVLNRKIDFLGQSSSWARDPDAYARTHYYGGGIHGANYERYYNHPNFKKLGFNPTRNNELIYNQNSSWWDDFQRMTSSFVDLAYVGFKSPFDFGSKNTAREYERAMALGMSTKDGPGKYFTNFMLNTAFTIGLAGEMIAENYAIAGATYLTKGAATPALLAAGGRDAMGFRKLYQMGDMVKSMKELTKRLLNPALADDFYKKANSTTVLGKAFDFINPFSHSVDYVKNLEKGANGFDKLNDFAKTRKAFGAFYRDLREMNLTVSESLMEGQSAANEKNRKEIDDYYRKNGKMPEGKAAEDIYDKAQNLNFSTSLANMPTIFLTNRLVFDNLFKGFKPPSVVGKELLENTSRTMSKSKAWKIGDDAYSFQERMAKGKLSKILYDNPYVPWGRAYMIGNLGEGVQELSQEIISASTEHYYDRLYSDPAASGLYNALVAIGQGTGEQFTAQGLETFLSGYLTGSVTQAAGKIFTSHKWAPGLYKQFFNTEEYKKEVSTQRERENQIMNAVNTVLKDPLGYFNDNVEHALRVRQLSEGMTQAELDGDEKSFHDNKNDLLFEHLYNTAHAGKMDMIVEHLDGLMQLDDKSLAEAMDQPESDAQAIRTRLGDAVTKAKMFQNVYDNYVEKYENPFNPLKWDREKNPDEWMNEAMNYKGFETARKNAILSTVLYGKTLERMDSLVDDMVKENVFKDVNSSDVTILMDQALLNDELDTLEKEISVLSVGDEKQKKEAEKLKQKKENLTYIRDLGMAHEMAMADMRTAMNENLKSSVMHTPGSIVKKKKNGEILTVVGETGKGTQLIVTTQYGKKKYISKRSVIPVTSGVHKQLREVNRKMYEVFKKYMTDLAQQSGAGPVDEQKMMRSFIKFRDHLALKDDAKRLMNSANTLNNPEYFMQHVRRMAEQEKIKMENMPEYIKASYQALMEKYKNNQFLNEIFDLGYTIDPEDAEQIIYGNYDVDLYHANTGQKVEPDDPKFAEAQKIIEKYQAMADAERELDAEKGEDVEVPDTEEEETEAEKPPVTETAAFDTDSKMYKDLVALFRKVEKQKADNGESTFGLEKTPDVQLATNQDFIEFTQTNSAAIRIIKNAPAEEKKAAEEAAKAEREKLDWTPKPVPPGLEKMKNLFKKVLHITEDEKNYFDEKGDLYDRVSAMKPDKEELKAVNAIIKRRAVQRGNVIDRAIRALFMDEIETREDLLNLINTEIRTNNYEIDFTKDAVDVLFTSLGEIKQAADQWGWKVHSDIPVLFGNYPGLKLPQGGKVAGTIDLLVEHNGEFFLIDIKSATRDRASDEGKDMYFDSDTIQLNVYRELIEQMTGVKIAGMFIFPITVKHGPRYKTVESISAPTFGVESLIEIPTIPVRQLVPELFEKGPETPPAAPAAPTAPAPATPAPTAPAAPASDIEAKKADIEKRRQEELSLIDEDTYLKEGAVVTGIIAGDNVMFKDNMLYTLGGTGVINGVSNVKGASSISSTKVIKDAVNAKYNAELAALGAAPAGVVTKSAEDLVREMLSSDGRMYTEFTVEEQKLIDNLPTERKLEIQKEIEEAGNKQKKKFKGDELQKMIDGAKDAAGYEKLKKALFRILSDNPHFRDRFNLTVDSVKQILKDKYNQLAMTFVKEDMKPDIYVKTKDGRNMQVISVTKDTFTIAPVTAAPGQETEIYSMSKLYDVVDSIYKDGMDKIESPVPQVEDVSVEKSTQKVSDKSVQDGQLTADKVNQLNAEVNSKSQDDIDNDVLELLCP